MSQGLRRKPQKRSANPQMGELLRELRRESGLSRQDLAKSLGTSQGRISKLETGEPVVVRRDEVLDGQLFLDYVPQDTDLDGQTFFPELVGQPSSRAGRYAA